MTRFLLLGLLAIAWLILIFLALRFQRLAWRHRSPQGKERLRWDRPRFRWLVMADPGDRTDFDEIGWRYRKLTLWAIVGAVGTMVAAWLLSWL